MGMQEDEKRLEAWEEGIADLRYAMSVLLLDSHAKPPQSGMAYGNRRRANLAAEVFRRQHDSDMVPVLERILTGSEERAFRRRAELHLRVIRQFEGICPQACAAFELAKAESQQAWLRLKPIGDFRQYAPYLKQLVDMRLDMTKAKHDCSDVFDRILEEQEPGWNTARYDAFFEELKGDLLPRLSAWRERAGHPAFQFPIGYYDVPRQKAYIERLVKAMGFDETWGRLGEAEHPLTTWLCSGDIRVTTKYRTWDPTLAVFSTVHESGHAWFAHQVNPAWEGTILFHGISAAMHESQARLCENHLGHSLAFWEWQEAPFRAAFPEMNGLNASDIWHCVNRVKPGPVRLEADEVTYPLHILIRYELEKAMFEGDLRVEELEDAWHDLYRSYLGVEVSDAAQGILSDMHWPYAYFGYFPTYALGSAMAAQFHEAMCRKLPIERMLRAGNFPDIMAWLGEQIHCHGAMMDSEDMLRHVTGEGFQAGSYLRHLENVLQEQS